MGEVLSQELQRWSLLHFESGVPICDINIRKENKERLARVSHVYFQWIKNPFLDYDQMLRQLCKGKFADAPAECHAAQKDQALMKFVIEHVSPPSRKVSEAKVRAAADRMMRIGMETDDVMALDKGSKRLMELDRLNQPESDQADMNKIAFLPSVVVTDIREVDDTKENIDDEETKRIIAKYGAYVDEKHKAVDDKVALMEAASGIGAEEMNSEEE